MVVMAHQAFVEFVPGELIVSGNGVDNAAFLKHAQVPVHAPAGDVGGPS